MATVGDALVERNMVCRRRSITRMDWTNEALGDVAWAAMGAVEPLGPSIRSSRPFIFSQGLSGMPNSECWDGWMWYDIMPRNYKSLRWAIQSMPAAGTRWL